MTIETGSMTPPDQFSVPSFAAVTTISHLNPESVMRYVSQSLEDIRTLGPLNTLRGKVAGITKRKKSFKFRREDVQRVANLLLAEDVRGDGVVWSRDNAIPPTFLEIQRAYLGNDQEIEAREVLFSELISTMKDKSGQPISGSCRQVIESHLADWTIGDLALTTLISNGGDIKAIPIEHHERLTRIGILNPERIVNLFADRQSAIETYRNFQNQAFSKALLAVWHRGNETYINRDHGFAWMAVQIYQLITDLLHSKNKHEPTYKEIQAIRDVGRTEFIKQESKHIRTLTKPGWHGALRPIAVIAAIGVCKTSGDIAPWENSLT